MTSTSELSDRTTMVVGASRGLGRGIATAFAEAGAPVIAVARTAAPPIDPAGGGGIQQEVADATDARVAASLLDRYEPEAIILVAGASPLIRPLQHQTWEAFSVNWHTDVRIAFQWLREALLKPLRPWQQGDRDQQRRGAAGIADQRRLRRRQGHPTLHHRLRPRGGKPSWPGHDLHRGAAPNHPADDLGRPAVAAYAARSGHVPELRRPCYRRQPCPRC